MAYWGAEGAAIRVKVAKSLVLPLFSFFSRPKLSIKAMQQEHLKTEVHTRALTERVAPYCQEILTQSKFLLHQPILHRKFNQGGGINGPCFI